jgi:hypothetical protein
MAEERMALSAKERERLKILHEIQQGHLPSLTLPRYSAWSGRCPEDRKYSSLRLD